MYSQCASCSSMASTPFRPLSHFTSHSPKNRHKFQPFPLKPRPSTRVVFISRSFSAGRHNKHSRNWNLIRCNQRGSPNHFPEASPSIIPSLAGEGGAVVGLPNCTRGERNGAFEFAVKPVAFTLLWLLLGLCPIKGWQPPATALPAISELIWKKKAKGKEKTLEKETVVQKDHYYSAYTRRLLEKANAVLKAMEEARVSNGSINDVKKALNDLKSAKLEIELEIDCELDAWQKELKSERKDLVKKSEKAANYVFNARSQQEWLHMKQDLASGGGGDEGLKLKMESLEKQVGRGVKEYDMLENKFEDLEDQVRTRVYVDLSILLAELSSIERESQRLVDRFIKDMERKPDESVWKSSGPELSRFDIKKDLEDAQKEHLKQLILPTLLEDEEPSSDSRPASGSDQVDSTLRIKQALESSKDLQRGLEAAIRKDMKKFGNEKRFIVPTSEEEIVKGFPELEMKWKFGNKEVVVPKAISVHLFHGWKKWREERKADLKSKLLENADLGKEYVNQKKERIVLDRDRVMSKTVFNEDKRRWEIDPVAVPYAVSKNLVEYARIRHDWGVMYIAMKGDDKEYYIDIQEYEILFEDFGGFDGLYLKMVASGIPISVQVMPIPVTELTLYQQMLIAGRFAFLLAYQFWKTKTVSSYKDYFIDDMKIIADDAMMRVLFPLVEFVIPYSVRIMIGMAWPEEIGQSVGTPWYLKWQSETEMRFRSRKAIDSFTYLKIFFRCAIYGYVLIHVIQFAWFMKKKTLRLLGFGPRFHNPNIRTKRQLIAIRRVMKKLIVRRKKFGVNPIKTAFENMQRVRKPPIPLRDFTTIESMREEINEVVTFLQNPNAYQKVGARAPKGVLIVGEMGSGKTSLALAIAAEARVPVVKVEPEQLEAAGLWVGQSAANIRELFQTARELAPVIIFVEDFDRFAGVRGKFIHTKKQDHEAFINQLLVELDGFEKQDGVVLMATTRNLSQIDPALKRPGRMDRIFNLTRPTQAEREKILWLAAKDTMDPDIIDFIDWSKLAEKTANLFPVDLKRVPVALEGSAFRSKFLDTDELLSYCGWFATFSWIVPTFLRRLKPVRKISSVLVNHLGLALTKEDLQNAVDLMEPYGLISNGIELLNPPVDWTREAKFSHAVWAAGRGLIALLLPNFDMVDNIWLEPLSWEGIGCTKITKAEDEGSGRGNVETISYLEKKLVFCFGSHVASQMLLPFGEETLLSMSELKQAQEIATRMVIQYGWGPDDSPAIYFHGNAVTALSMGDQYEFEVASKVEKIYNLAYDKAKEMLQKNRQVLEKIVEELLEFSTLSGKDLEKIIVKNGGVREKEPFSLSRGYESELVSVNYLAGGTSSGNAFLGSAN